MLLSNAKIEECEDCDEKWNIPNTLVRLHWRLRVVVNLNRHGTLEEYNVPPETFYSELSDFLKINCGKDFKKNIIEKGDIETSDSTISAYRDRPSK